MGYLVINLRIRKDQLKKIPPHTKTDPKRAMQNANETIVKRLGFSFYSNFQSMDICEKISQVKNMTIILKFSKGQVSF